MDELDNSFMPAMQFAQRTHSEVGDFFTCFSSISAGGAIVPGLSLIRPEQGDALIAKHCSNY